MSSPKWTPEQQAAIDLRGQILVAAAAGSGKTAVLVQRLIERITHADEKVDVDRFLVVTFTKAAAAEMRERIGKALGETLFAEADPAEVEHLLHQRALLYRASITTLHSFCMELLRQYFYQIELDPAFRIADEAEADLLRQETLEDLFEDYYSDDDPAFQALVDAFGTDRDDQPLMESILRLHGFAMSQVHPAEWLDQLPLAYQWNSLDELLKSPWGVVVRQGILDKVEESLNGLEWASHIAQQPGGPLQYIPVLQDDLSRLQLLQKALDNGVWSEVESALREATAFPSLPRGSKKNSSESAFSEDEIKQFREESKNARDGAKKKLEEIKTSVFSVPLTEQLVYLKKMESLIQTLVQVTQKFILEYQSAKRKRNIVDFSDLEHYALSLLEIENQYSPIALKLQEFYAEVLVDEYQDINPVQERILQCVSRQEGPHANLFMVGDVKQSIYRFRMADPRLFLRKYSDFPHFKVGEEAPAPNLVIDLNQNFRSRSGVIQGINYLFYQIMTEGAGEIAYDNQAALRAGAKFISNPELKTAEGPIEVHLFDPKCIDLSSSLSHESAQPGEMASLSNSELHQDKDLDSGEDDATLEDVESARIEARLVATRIQKMIQGCEFIIHDKVLGDFRPVQYSDVVILMRSLSSVAPVYLEEFQNAGIPVYAETNSGYFGANEVDTILSLLKVIDNPRLDIPLAAVLRSPLVGMNGTELGKLRSLLPHGDFYETIVLAYWASQKDRQEVAENEEVKDILTTHQEYLTQLEAKAKAILTESPEIKEKVNSFYPKLQAWRQSSRRTSLADLIWHLYEETGFLAYVGTLPSGSQRQANLRVLYDRACRYEATHYRGLFRFLRFLEKFQGQGKDFGSASTVGEKDNVVRLITVHSSKGLEFPVIFMVGLGKKFNTRSLNNQLLLHSQLGVGVPLIDVENQVRYPSIIQYAVKERLWQESLAEELRILYVALTRAKERLFLYGQVNKLSETLEKWQTLASTCSEISFTDGQLRSAKTFLDWIGPALARYPEDLFGLGHRTLDYGLPDSAAQWKIIIHENISVPSAEEIGVINSETGLCEPLIMVESNKLLEPNVVTELKELQLSSNQGEEGVRASAGASVEKMTLANIKEEVFRRLSWHYPSFESVRQVAKTSVSELKRQMPWYLDGEYEPQPAQSAPSFSRPKFVQSQRDLTPAEKGTAMHTAIQHLPLTTWRATWESLPSEEKNNTLELFRNSLIQTDILTEEQGKAVSIDVLLKLLDSATGKRLLEAEEVRREVPFTLSLSLKVQKEPVLVQGIIDAIVIDHREQGADIIDFKTDYLIGDTNPEETLTQRYALQLGLYAMAVERLLDIPVQDCLIYATTLNQEFKISREVIQSALESVSIDSISHESKKQD
ncbi:MAG: UvrD-helicase domain-containing protein [Desulfitobacterium sp.]